MQNMSFDIPPPTRGLNYLDNLHSQHPSDAVRMLNFYPSTHDIHIRDGYAEFLNARDIGNIVRFKGRIMGFDDNGAGVLVLFGEDNEGDTRLMIVGEQGSIVMDTEIFSHIGASGAYFNRHLIITNGSQIPRVFSFQSQTWSSLSWTAQVRADDATTPLFTLNSTMLNRPAVYQSRLWMCENNAPVAYYAGVEEVTGSSDVRKFSLEGVADSRTRIVAIAPWTRHETDTLAAYLAFILESGEVLVYQGSFPEATDWALSARINMPKPISSDVDTYAEFGGDIVILTEAGLSPLSQWMQGFTRDKIDLSNSPSSPWGRIRSELQRQVEQFRGLDGWAIFINPKNRSIYINVPVGTDEKEQFVLNPITNAWTRFNSIDADSWAGAGNFAYFLRGGVVYRHDGLLDDEDEILASYLSSFQEYQTHKNKMVNAVQLHVDVSSRSCISVGVQVDRFVDTPTPSQEVLLGEATDGSLWDESLWGEARWTTSGEEFNDWLGVYANGNSLAIFVSAIGQAGAVKVVGTRIRFMKAKHR